MEKTEIIVISKEIRKILLETWSWPTIRKALDGSSKTVTTLAVREKALELGGKYWK